MTRLVARTVMWLALSGVLFVAGFHFVYYLLKWEWGRAAIAGSGFTAGLVLASAYLLLNRMLRIEHRLDLLLAATQDGAQQSGQQAPTPDGSVGEPRPDFPWLAPSTTLHALGGVALGLAAVTVAPPDQSVFIPVFLAAGLAISAVAGGVERLAAWRHRGTPVGVGAPVRGGTSAPTAQEILSTRSPGLRIALPVLIVVTAALTVATLYWTTHYWSQPMGPGITTMTVEVERKGGAPTVDTDVVEIIGRYCTINAGTIARYVGVEPGSGGSTVLQVRPLLDEEAQTRYIGCMEDSVLEWHQLRVTETVIAGR